MTDLMTILALMFGFALLCVMAAIYWLSRRQIHVTQNNSTSVTTSDRTDSSTGGSGRVERFLIKWTFILLVCGIAIATLANAVTTATASFPNAREAVGNPSVAVATPAPMPTVSAPLPLPLGEGRGEGASTNPLTIIIPILAGAAASIWGNIIISVIRINRARRRTSPAKREAQLESILPDAVNQL